MAIEAGKVTVAVGEFIAIGKDGSQRVLHVGDTVYEGETIKAHGGSEIEIINGDDVYSGGSDANFTVSNLNAIKMDDPSMSEDDIDKEINELIGERIESYDKNASNSTTAVNFSDEPIVDAKEAAVSGKDEKEIAVSGEMDAKEAAVSGSSESFFYTGGGGGGGSVAARFVADTTGLGGVGAHAEAMMASGSASTAPINANFGSGSLSTSEIESQSLNSVWITQDGDMVEEGASHQYTIHLNQPVSTDTDVTVVVGHITTDDGDILPVTKTVTIKAGETTETFSLTNIDDNIIENIESYEVKITNVNNNDIVIDHEQSSVITNIEDNDYAKVCISQETNSVDEGESHTYTVTLDKPTISDTNVTVVVENITTENGDVVPVTKTVTIPAGSTSATFTLNAVDDNLVEGNEDFKVVIDSVEGTNVTIDTQGKEVTTTINDNDRATISLTQETDVIDEGDSNTYTITMDKASESDTTVTITVGHITTDDGDVLAVTRDIVIPAGQTSAQFIVNSIDDDIAESNEDFKVTIDSVDNPQIDINPQAKEVVTTIVDNDTCSMLSLTQETNTVDEGDNHTYTLHLDQPSQSDTTVTIQVGNITTEDTDVAPLTQTVVIPAGETSATFTIEAIDDNLVEGSEDYEVCITDVDGVNVSVDTTQNSVTTTINDNDTATVSLSQQCDMVEEGDTNTYTISLDKVSENDTTVVVEIAHNTTDEADLHAETRTIVIPAGESSATFEVTNTDDSTYESDETYNVKIVSVEDSQGSASLVVDESHNEVTTTIIDNDWSGDWSGDCWYGDCWHGDCSWGDDPITVLADGGYIVPFLATTDVNSADGDGYGVFFQRYDADGNKVGEAQLANTTTEGNQFEADVATLKDGGYVLAWQSDNGDGSGNGIFLQRYDADGNRVGEEVQVNTNSDGNQEQVAITGLKDGGYTIAWQTQNGDDSGYCVALQKYDADGNRVGDEMIVNQTTAANQNMPSIDALENGGFVVTWQSDSENGKEVYSRVFSCDMKASDEIHINTTEDGSQVMPMVSGLSDGGFVATWLSHDGSEACVNLQRFDESGCKVGEEVEVTKLTDFDLYSNVAPEVAGLSDGGYAVVFADKDSDGSGVYCQRFDANGEEIGDRILLNTDESSNQYNPHIAADENGGFVTTWVNVNEDMSSMEVVGQRFDSDGNRVGDMFEVSQITTDTKEVESLLSTHEVNHIDTTVEYLDFDGLAQSAEVESAVHTDAMPLENQQVNLSDLIDTVSDEIEINVPEITEQPVECNSAHEIKPAVISELTQEVVDIQDQHVCIDVLEHHVQVDEV